MSKDNTTLDITDLSQKLNKEQLFARIAERMEFTQTFVIQPYPYKLRMRRDQFDILKPDEESIPGMDFFAVVIGNDLHNLDVIVEGENEPRV